MRIMTTLLVALLATGGGWGQVLRGEAAPADELGRVWDHMKALKSYRMKMTLNPQAMPGQHSSAEEARMVTEFVTPDRSHMLMEMHEGTVEIIRIGDEAATRTDLKGSPQPAPTRPGGMGLDQFLSMAIGAFTNPMGFAMELAMNALMSGMTSQFASAASGTWHCQHLTSHASSALGPRPGPMQGELTVSRLGDVVIEGAKTHEYEYASTPQQHGPMPAGKMRVYVLEDEDLPRRLEILNTQETLLATMDYYDYNAPITIDLPRCG